MSARVRYSITATVLSPYLGSKIFDNITFFVVVVVDVALSAMTMEKNIKTVITSCNVSRKKHDIFIMSGSLFNHLYPE